MNTFQRQNIARRNKLREHFVFTIVRWHCPAPLWRRSCKRAILQCCCYSSLLLRFAVCPVGHHRMFTAHSPTTIRLFVLCAKQNSAGCIRESDYATLNTSDVESTGRDDKNASPLPACRLRLALLCFSSTPTPCSNLCQPTLATCLSGPCLVGQCKQ